MISGYLHPEGNIKNCQRVIELALSVRTGRADIAHLVNGGSWFFVEVI